MPQKGGLTLARLAVGVAYGLVILAAAGTFAYAAAGKASHQQRTPVAVQSQAPAAAQLPVVPGPTPASQPPPAPVPTPVSQPPAVPTHFGTLPPGAALPSGSQCAAWVRALPMPENKRMNATANQVTGEGVGADLFGGDAAAANQVIAPRIDGRFNGTTHEILRWAACKWGVDEDLVAAEAAIESWWRQPTLGDFGTDPTRCPPGHGLGVDGTPGKCPESYGVLQNRYPYERSTWPGIGSSTAMNADTAYAIWRACFEGYEQWLNSVDRGSQYSAGDALGCVGRWFSGRWHTAASDGYVAKVNGYLGSRVWETADFQEP